MYFVMCLIGRQYVPERDEVRSRQIEREKQFFFSIEKFQFDTWIPIKTMCEFIIYLGCVVRQMLRANISNLRTFQMDKNRRNAAKSARRRRRRS